MKTNPENAATNTYVVAEVTDDEAVSIQPLAEESLKTGNQYIFRETFDRSTNNPNLKVLIEQPEGADEAIRVIGNTIESTKELLGTVSFNVGVDSRGTSFRNANSKITDPMEESSNETVEYGGTYTKDAGGEADALPLEILDTGEGINRRSFHVNSAAFRLTPGTNILYDLDAQADGTDIIFEVRLSERPQI